MNKSTTILFITHYAGLYGANRSLLDLIDGLTKNFEVNPVIFLRKGKGEDASLMIDALKERKIIFFLATFLFYFTVEAYG